MIKLMNGEINHIFQSMIDSYICSLNWWLSCKRNINEYLVAPIWSTEAGDYMLLCDYLDICIYSFWNFIIYLINHLTNHYHYTLKRKHISLLKMVSQDVRRDSVLHFDVSNFNSETMFINRMEFRPKNSYKLIIIIAYFWFCPWSINIRVLGLFPTSFISSVNKASS